MNDNIKDNLDLLYKVQLINNEIGKYVSYVGNIPREIENIQDRISKICKHEGALMKKINDLQKEISDANIRIYEYRDNLEKYNNQIDMAMTAREYTVLESQVKGSDLKIKLEERNIGQRKQDILKQEEILNNIRATKETLNEQLTLQNKKLHDLQQSNEEKIEVLSEQKTKLYKKIDPEFEALYDGIFEHIPNKQAAVHVVNGVCSGCNLEIPLQTQINVIRYDNINRCDNCAAIICGVDNIDTNK